MEIHPWRESQCILGATWNATQMKERGGWRSEIKTVSPFQRLPCPSVARLCLSFLTSAEYSPMATSGCLQDQLISSTFYYEYFWLSSAPCALYPRSFPVDLFRSSLLLIGEELKHIRPALDFDSIAKWGRIRRALSVLGGYWSALERLLESEAFSEYHSVCPVGAS